MTRSFQLPSTKALVLASSLAALGLFALIPGMALYSASIGASQPSTCWKGMLRQQWGFSTMPCANIANSEQAHTSLPVAQVQESEPES